MNTRPLLSIITSIYNGGQDLLKFLQSISNQTYDNIELIIVDDCSTDELTKSIIDDFINKRIEFKKPFTFIKNNKNLGLVKSFQKGLDKARGEYFAFPESDDYLDEDFYEILMNTILAKKANVVKGLLLFEYTKPLNSVNKDIEDNKIKEDKEIVSLFDNIILPIAIKDSDGRIISYIMPDITYSWFYVFDKNILQFNSKKLSFKNAMQYGFSNAPFYAKYIETKVPLSASSFYHYNAHPNYVSGVQFSLDKREKLVKSEQKLVKKFLKNYDNVIAHGESHLKGERQLIRGFVKNY